ncbi:MAG: hypothetical protein ABTQ34_08390 [Bdellovibrionales bacterium]
MSRITKPILRNFACAALLVSAAGCSSVEEPMNSINLNDQDLMRPVFAQVPRYNPDHTMVKDKDGNIAVEVVQLQGLYIQKQKGFGRFDRPVMCTTYPNTTVAASCVTIDNKNEALLRNMLAVAGVGAYWGNAIANLKAAFDAKSDTWNISANAAGPNIAIGTGGNPTFNQTLNLQ